MGETTGISWTDHTFNPWWGCVKVSAECTNCYAESTSKRFGGELWGPNGTRRFFGDKHWNEPIKWNASAVRDGVRRRVFCASMADVFEDRRDLDAARARLWNLIENTPHLDWLLLTKRPENIRTMLPGAAGLLVDPFANVWLGVTGGTSDTLRDRVALLRRIPAAVRFVSCEPLLEHIHADVWDQVLRRVQPRGFESPNTGPIHWLIVGDESGNKRRAAQVDWVRTAREAAIRHGVAFHFKQWCGSASGGIAARIGNVDNGRKIHLPILDGRQWAEFPK